MRALKEKLQNHCIYLPYGRVRLVRGGLVAFIAPSKHFFIGAGVKLQKENNTVIKGEVIGFKDGLVLAMFYGRLDGACFDGLVYLDEARHELFPSDNWLGRIINGRGEAVDDKGALHMGNTAYSLYNKPPIAARRAPLGPPCDTGVRAINCFTTMCAGQRMGIFAGSGVGKSVLMSMLVKQAQYDVIVLALIGERGREVGDFISRHLSKEALARTILVVATSDEAALMRKRAALTAMTVAEYFRDQGKNTLLMMDSLTRYAMALREIGLALGEPPATRGYPPSVFAELPKLLERAGPGEKGREKKHENNGKTGSISALCTVLIEGDDLNEPVSDTVRGILDGHIVLDRDIAQRGRYPAINILKSISRTMPHSTPPSKRDVVAKARASMMQYEDMQELIRMGVYKKGANEQVDRAIELHPHLEAFLSQNEEEIIDFDKDFETLEAILKIGVEAGGL